jgi:hypothetical protein
MAPRWGPAETDRLDYLAGNVPYSALSRHYNNWARQHGHATRTAKAIRLKIADMGLSAYPIGEWIGTAAIIEALHVCGFTARWWITHLGLPASRDGARWAVRRSDLRVFARENPRLFARATRPALVQLLEDEALADMITDGKHYYPHRPRPVRCLETGQVFPSLAAAARASFVVRQVIRKAIRTGGFAAGYHWIWAE